MTFEGVDITNRQLDLVVPQGLSDVINSISDINKNGIDWNLIEF